MSIFECIVIALALGIESMIIVRPCAEAVPIRLTRGLLVSAIITLIFAVMMIIGLAIGDLLAFTDESMAGQYQQTNELIYLGFMIIVSVKLLMGIRKKNSQPMAYNLSRWTTVFALAIAAGINVMLVGMGVAFVAEFSSNWVRCVVPLVLITWLLTYWAIMLGRSKTAIRERRWKFIVVLLLLMSAIFRVVEF